MFFTLSKIIWMLVNPMNLVFLAMTAGLMLALCRRFRPAWFLTAAGAAIMLIFGVSPLGYALVGELESKYVRPAETDMPEDIDGIIVLGGSFDTSVSAVRGFPALSHNTDRLMQTLILARRFPDAVIVFSGGNGGLSGGKPEANDAKIFFETFLPEAENIVYEGGSRNTYENAIKSKALVKPQEGQKWFLVTSAYHMPRAMGVFQSTDWRGIVAWPADYRTTGHDSWRFRGFDILGGLYLSHLALREYLGRAAYIITGKIEIEPSPGG